MIDELELKKTYNDRMEAFLTAEQRESVIDPDIHNMGLFDVQSPLIAVNMFARPVPGGTREKLRASAVKAWSKGWGMEAALLESQGPLVDGWLADQDPRLTPVGAGQEWKYYFEDALAAGRAQIKLMKGLLASLTLNEEVRKKMISEPNFLIPRLVEKE